MFEFVHDSLALEIFECNNGLIVNETRFNVEKV